MPCPLNGIYVTVFPGGLTAVNNVQQSEENPEPCTKVTLELLFSIHSPDNIMPTGIHDVFSEIIDDISNNTSFCIKSGHCDELKHVRSTNSYLLPASLVVEVYYCPGEDDTNTYVYGGREYLCVTHAGNSDVHLSAAERNWINQPYVVGEYVGNGTTSGRAIVLGFRPTSVIVGPQAMPSYVYNSEADELYCYSGFSNSSGNCKGMSINSQGFSVIQTPSQKYNGFLPRLNHDGVTYIYTAFR